MDSISAKSHAKKTAVINGQTMAYVEMGQGDPIVFLHGNPTSSYLWRNIMPHVRDIGRCLAPDLIGMGDSAKLDPPDYRFVVHRAYLDGLLDALNVKSNVVLVIHDWGSALGFHWAHRHRERVRGIVYMEAVVQPIASWEGWPDAAREIFQAFRSPAGEEMILENNIFVERVLPGSVVRPLSEEEMAEYRRPFAEKGEARRPTLTWPRQIPIGGEPADVTELAAAYAQWMSENEIPKLFINADPGAILTGGNRAFCRKWKNQKEITVKGSHFIQEDSPHEIGEALAQWIKALP